jgi:serine/threonine-protein kinase
VSEAVIPPSTFNPLISAELDQVVLHALAKDRNDRYQSAEEFREHLLAADITPPAPGENVVPEAGAVEEVAAEGDGVWASEPTPTGELPEAAATEEPATQDSLDEFEALLAAGGLEATATVTTVAEPVAAEPSDQVESPESHSEVAPVTPVAPIEAVSEVAAPASQPVFNQPIAKTEAITTDTDPFGALGLKFDKDAGAATEPETTSTGSTKTKAKTPALQNPGVLWGVGSAAVVFMVGVVIWLLTVSLPNLNPNPGGIPVADVSGKVYQEAYDTLTAQKLLVDRQYEASETVPADTVIRTDPVAGTAVPENTTITVWVSLGKTQIDMPDLRGMNEKMATDLLAQTKLTLGEIVQGHSATVAAGQIIETDPPAGTKVAEGAVVNITISDGLVVVPDVTNYSISEAKGYLTAPDVALSVEIGTLEACDVTPAGTIVVGQSIGAGTAPAGSTIVLYVTCKP